MPASPDRRRVGWGVAGCGRGGRERAGPARATPPSPDRPRGGWGVAGCGGVGRDLAGPAIAASRNGRLIALCDRRPEELERVAAAPPEAARHQDLAEFLATPGLDAVYVATPNDSHAALTR